MTDIIVATVSIGIVVAALAIGTFIDRRRLNKMRRTYRDIDFKKMR